MCNRQRVHKTLPGLAIGVLVAASGCHNAPPHRATPPGPDTILAGRGDAASPTHAVAAGDAATAIPRGDAATPGSNSDADSPQAAAILAAIAARLPSGWGGTGVLARRKERLPRHAPAWARIEAEVVDSAGKRFLVTSGLVRGIRNRALATQTAGARARAQLARWLGTDHLVYSEITNTWSTRRGAVTLARARIAVPNAWQPGQPLPQTP